MTILRDVRSYRIGIAIGKPKIDRPLACSECGAVCWLHSIVPPAYDGMDGEQQPRKATVAA